MSKTKKDPEFEKSLAELEKLVEQMEDGELSLEASIKTYERGVVLGRSALRALDDAEQRVRILNDADAAQSAAGTSDSDSVDEAADHD